MIDAAPLGDGGIEELVESWTFVDTGEASGKPYSVFLLQASTSPVTAIPVLRRLTGALIAIPSGSLDPALLGAGWTSDTMIGPSVELNVAAFARNNRAASRTLTVPLILVDVSAEFAGLVVEAEDDTPSIQFIGSDGRSHLPHGGSL